MFKKFKPVLIKFLKTFIPLAFGLLVFWLIFKKLEFRQILTILQNDVNFWIIALSLPFGLLGNIIRAYRWDLLIKPLGYRPKKSNLIYSFLGTYGVNLVFPRLGEVWRCTMINRYEKIPLSVLIGTMITDRLFDFIPIGLIVMAAFILNVPYFEAFIAQNPGMFDLIYNIATSVWIYVILAAGVGAAWFSFVYFKEFALIKKVKSFLLNTWEGIMTIIRMKDKWMFIFHTCLIWLCYFLYFYICFYAFPFTKDLGWNCGLIAFGISSVSVTIPIQGSMGVWHFVVIAVLTGFGINSVDAGAFALCVHSVQALIFTGMFGLFGIMALPIANRKK